MYGPPASPFTDTGRLQGAVDELSRRIDGKADEHEVSSLRGVVDRLEHSLREACAEIACLRDQLSQVEAELAMHQHPEEE